MMKYLQKPAVQMGLLAVVVAGAAGAFFLTKRPGPPANTPKGAENSTPVSAPKAVEEQKVALGEDRKTTLGSDSQVQRFVIPKEKPKAPTVMTTTQSEKGKKKAKPPPFPRLVHVTNPAPERFEAPAPRFFAPRGMLIKAALVLTIDSSSLDTPVLALVTEDVYWNERLIVPAGTQVQAKASNGRTRDRIEVKGTYIFVWADGREYNINCVALDHERLPDGTYGITDGSAGIRGQIIKNDAYAEVKILLAEALQGMMNNGQEQFQTIYGLAPANSNRNAALGGGAAASSAYSDLLTKKLDQDLDFVRIPAGTQFYIFTRDVFEPDLASVAGLKQGGEAASSWQLAEQTYLRAQAAEASGAEKAATAAEQARKIDEQRKTAEQAERVRELVTPTPEAAGAAAVPTSTSSQP